MELNGLFLAMPVSVGNRTLSIDPVAVPDGHKTVVSEPGPVRALTAMRRLGRGAGSAGVKSHF